MKFSATLALVVIVGLVASSNAFPAQKNCDHAEAEISAAGPAVAFEAPAPVDVAAEHGEDVLSEAHATQAQAESYPVAGEAAFEVPADVDIVAEENEVPDDDAKVPRDFNLDGVDSSNAHGAGVDAAVVPEQEAPVADVDAAAEYPAEAPVDAAAEAPEAPVEAGVESGAGFGVAAGAGVASDYPVPAPIAPVAKKPVNRYLPAKKKVYVELDQSVESAEGSGLVAASEEADEDDDDEHAASVTRRPARRPVGKKPAKAAAGSKKEQKPLPVGTFFPVNFGGTKGGAIAIANSFSTGEGGSATSHAIAYGSPDAAALRGCVTCKKH
ncbi:uncharacterized protein ACRADG_002603 isoform 2-T2 [Cochliomyia hominivorax]